MVGAAMTDTADEPATTTEDPTPSPGASETVGPDAVAPSEEAAGSSAAAPKDVGARIRELVEAEPEEDDTPAQSHPLSAIGAEPMTEDALEGTDFHVCPFCDGWGAADPDALLAALPVIVERLAPYPQSPVFYRCPDCDGWGRALTGARLGEPGIQPCPSCDGRGYRDRREETPPDGAPLVEGALTPAPRPAGPDPMRLSPAQGGEPPAPGMVWFDEQRVWAYPSAPVEAA